MKTTNEVIRTYPAVEGGVLLTVTPSNSVVYNSRGQLDGVALGSQVTINYAVADFCDLDREITINAVGRVSSSKGGC